jgi:hypothetical protein
VSHKTKTNLLSPSTRMGLWAAVIGTSTLAGTPQAQAKPARKAPVKNSARPKTTKPAAKPAAKLAKPTSDIKGMVPLAGLEGKVGTTYTLGQDTQFNFTLDSAEFSVQRLSIDESSYAPKADEKLLVLNFTVHNPNKEIANYNWSTLRFTVVDASNQNREDIQAVGQSQTRQSLAMELKPAQKVSGYTAIVVPAKGVVPKLIVTPSSGGGVLRYDLRQAVKGLPAPFTSADDATGATVATEVKATTGQAWPLGTFDAELVSTAYTNGPLGEYEAEEGKRFFVATVKLRNGSTSNALYNWSTVEPTLVASDGEKAEWNQVFLKTTRNEGADGELKPGEEYTGRYFFQLPSDVSAKSFSIKEGESRTYTFDVSNTK